MKAMRLTETVNVLPTGFRITDCISEDDNSELIFTVMLELCKLEGTHRPRRHGQLAVRDNIQLMKFGAKRFEDGNTTV